MKIYAVIIHIIFCFIVMVLIAGCSASQNQASTLWEQRQMEDDRRLYGDPYATLNRQSYIQFYTNF